MNQPRESHQILQSWSNRKPPLWKKATNLLKIIPADQTQRNRSCGIMSSNQAKRFQDDNITKSGQNQRFLTERRYDDIGIEIDDGFLYKGQLQDGKPNGFGRLYFGSRCVYEGNWMKGQKHGKGIQYDQNSVYEGHFDQDKKSGQGSLIFIDKQFEGDWIDDSLVGITKIKYNDGSQYEGYTKYLLRDGKGRYCYDGGYYDGDWKNDKRQGSGRFYTNDGFFYDGNWFNDKQQGFGVGYLENKQWYIGQWDRGQPNGQGTMIDQNGVKQDGIFHNGKHLIDGYKYQDKRKSSIQQIIDDRKKKLFILLQLKKQQSQTDQQAQNTLDNRWNDKSFENHDYNILRDIQNSETKKNKSSCIQDIQLKLKGLGQIIQNIYPKKK
ncbi:hypothetical protein pb186bvf_020566 [Paramecium bursaria]